MSIHKGTAQHALCSYLLIACSNSISLNVKAENIALLKWMHDENH